MELEHKANVCVPESRKFLLLHLAYVRTINIYRTCIRTIQSPHNLKQCGLSGSAGTYDTYYLSFGYLQIYPFQHLQRTETLGYTF